MPKITPIRPGGEPPSPAAFFELREQLEAERKSIVQVQGILDTLNEHLLDDDHTTAQACGAASALLARVDYNLAALGERLERGEVKP